MSGTRQRAALKHTSKKEARSYLSPPPGEPWLWISRSLLLSPAYAALSRAGVRVLTRLCIENMDHAGRENGRLAVSYTALADFGVERRSISKALTELDLLGFVRRTVEGRRAHGSVPGRVACYRLTFAGTVGDKAAKPTDEWKKITKQDASRIEAALKAKRRGRGTSANGEVGAPVPAADVVELRRAG